MYKKNPYNVAIEIYFLEFTSILKINEQYF